MFGTRSKPLSLSFEAPSRSAYCMAEIYEVRCPIHGFVTLNPFEWELMNHEYFQRLRRIRQLGWTDVVYPGAMHTRFEHSLGVMHTATLMFDELWRRRKKELVELEFSEEHHHRDRAVLRLVSLLHDIGHSPFSHVGEDLMPIGPKSVRYSHEDYSSALIREMAGFMDEHRFNGYSIRASEVANTLDAKKTGASRANLFWRQLMSGQFDADRADYLLRDSYHTGVQYGHYDLNRLLISLTVGRHPETGDAVLAVEEGGWHTAEALILARYMMFSQVYFHKTRSIYDKHVTDALRVLLAKEQANSKLGEKDKFPPPTAEHLTDYFNWDDWRVQGLIRSGEARAEGEILTKRKHFRMVYEWGAVDTSASTEIPSDEKERGEKAQHDYEVRRDVLKEEGLLAHESDSGQSWYKLNVEIFVALGRQGGINRKLVPLSEMSPLVRALRKSRLRRLYVKHEDREKAEKILTGIH